MDIEPMAAEDEYSRDTDSSAPSPGSANSHFWLPVEGRSEGGRPRRHKETKICGVCGDKALGYNFDAISCESCKAFFRRNANKGLDYFKCPYDERCRMDQSNRRFCKRCRLKKCFEIGMRKEYILTEEEKLQKRRKIEENRSRKMSTRSEDCSRYHFEGELLSSLNVAEVTSQTVALSLEDNAAIEELLTAYHKSLEIQMDKVLSRNQATFADLVNIAELSIRRVIAMAKQIRSFKVLPQIDQIHLLKGGSIELLILRSVITFDKERQHFLDPLDREDTQAMSIEQLQSAETGTGLFEEHMKFVRSLAIDLRADEPTLILLLVISLFSPDRSSASGNGNISMQQERYSLLLEKYLWSKYPMMVARQLFPKLLMKLTDIRNLNEEHSHVLLKVNPEGIQPLMKEVLELSH